MNQINFEEQNQCLINCLLNIPFPYNDILQEQINAATYQTRNSGYFHELSFSVAVGTQPFPRWLDQMPLSWQIRTPDAPLLCQIFTENGYICTLEIIDMGFSEINWDWVQSGEALLDYEFDSKAVCNHIAERTIKINGMQLGDGRIDWFQETDENQQTVCFRGCTIRKLELSTPCCCFLRVTENSGDKHRFTICSDDGAIDFDCCLFFLQPNTLIN